MLLHLSKHYIHTAPGSFLYPWLQLLQHDHISSMISLNDTLIVHVIAAICILHCRLPLP